MIDSRFETNETRGAREQLGLALKGLKGGRKRASTGASE